MNAFHRTLAYEWHWEAINRIRVWSPNVWDDLVWDLDFISLVLITELRILDHRSFLERAFIREFAAAFAQTSTKIAYLNRYLQKARTNRNGKKVEREIRPECKGESGFVNNGPAVHGDRKGNGS